MSGSASSLFYELKSMTVNDTIILPQRQTSRVEVSINSAAIPNGDYEIKTKKISGSSNLTVFPGTIIKESYGIRIHVMRPNRFSGIRSFWEICLVKPGGGQEVIYDVLPIEIN
jgi:hypothetical protein